MKANAPKKIYFSQTEDGRQYFTPAIPFEREFVEYMPVDAFIKKAEKFIYSALNDGIMGTANIEDFMRLFKKYMEEQL